MIGCIQTIVLILSTCCIVRNIGGGQIWWLGLNWQCENFGGFKFHSSVRDHSIYKKFINLAFVKADSQTTKFNSLSNFLAIWYKEFVI